MSIKYALIKDYVVFEIKTIETEEEVQALSSTCQQVIDITDYHLDVQVGWIFNGLVILPPVGQDEADYIAYTVYDPVKKFCDTLQRRFIAENIKWGITAQNKTRAVGDFMEDIEKWFKRASLKEVIEEISVAKARLVADPTLAANLSPFCTVARLSQYQLEILRYLGLA